jgi:hypothetical protein
MAWMRGLFPRPDLRSGVRGSHRAARSPRRAGIRRLPFPACHKEPDGPCPLNRTSQARAVRFRCRNSLAKSDVVRRRDVDDRACVVFAGRSRSELVVPPSVQHRGAANEVSRLRGRPFPRATPIAMPGDVAAPRIVRARRTWPACTHHSLATVSSLLVRFSGPRAALGSYDYGSARTWLTPTRPTHSFR